MQTRKHSIIESFANILFGYTVAILSQVIIFPWFNIDIPLSDNLIIGFYFSVISIIRSYIIRRWFNKITTYMHMNKENPVLAGKSAHSIIVDDLEISAKPMTQKEKDDLLEWYKKTFSKAPYCP